MPMIRTTLDLFGKAKQYYTRGAGTVGLAIQLINTIVIWYGLMPGLSETFGENILYFAAIFTPGYAIVMIIFGWWDMKKGLYKSEIKTQMKKNPWAQTELYLHSHMQEIWDNTTALQRILDLMEDPEDIKRVQDRIKELEHEHEHTHPRETSI